MKTRKSKFLMYAATLLLFAGGMTMCSKDSTTPAVDKTAMTAAITAANTLLAGAKEGVAEGNYLKGSKATYQTAVTAAQAVVADAAATQAQVTAALASLNAATATFNGSLVTAIDKANLAGQWTFDEVATTTAGTVVKDYSGNSRDGQIKVGHPFWGSGVVSLVADRYGVAGKALGFDKGANVEVPYSAGLNPGIMSLSVWAKPAVNNPIVNNQYFISMNRWNGYKFNFQDTPRAFFTATYDDPSANPPKVKTCCYDRDQHVGTAKQGEWHHYVLTFGGGHEVFYIDGILVYDWGAVAGEGVAGTISTLASPVNLVFGQGLPTAGYVGTPDDGYYIGALDEVRIYKSVLTPAQVTSIYNIEKP